MTTLSFIAELIKALVWPALIVAVAFIFREELGALITSIKSVKAAGVSVEIEQHLKEARAEAERLPPSAAEPKAFAGGPPPSEELALLYPGAAILAAWSEIEQGLYAAAEQAGLDTRVRAPAVLLRQLHEANVLSASILAIADDLRGIRNQIAHPRGGNPDVTPEQAREYLGLAEQVLAALPRPNSNS